jgi:hypothetical protein
MDSKYREPDDCRCSQRRSRAYKEVVMREDSLSEGHIYFGRFAAVLAAIVVLSYVIPHL